MARLFGILANRPELVSRAAARHEELLTERGEPNSLGWGIGFYQGGEVLLRRRPVEDRGEVSLVPAIAQARTDTLIGHVRKATVGALTTENTHPFRYRQWLFAHTGTLAGFESMRDRLTDSIPQFLRRNVRGETDSELLFYLFLSFLHDAGVLSDPVVPSSLVASSLRATLSLVDRLSQEEGVTPEGMNLLVTPGDYLLGVTTASRMAWKTLKGAFEIADLYAEDGKKRPSVPDIDGARLSILAADMPDVPEGFTSVPERSIVTVRRADDPLVEAL